MQERAREKKRHWRRKKKEEKKRGRERVRNKTTERARKRESVWSRTKKIKRQKSEHLRRRDERARERELHVRYKRVTHDVYLKHIRTYLPLPEWIFATGGGAVAARISSTSKFLSELYPPHSPAEQSQNRDLDRVRLKSENLQSFESTCYILIGVFKLTSYASYVLLVDRLILPFLLYKI